MDTLDGLASSYKQRYQWNAKDVRNGFNGIYKEYIARRKQDILDSVAVGVALESLLDGNKIDVDAMPEDVRVAFHEAFPNLSIDSLNDRSPDELEGLLNAWKGKLFEVDVRDQLNDGLQVGDWQLEAGQHAELAASATQPGWDLKIVDDDGSIAEVIQLKATDSATYVNHALERYSDIPIISTNDIADHSDALSAADISDHDVTSQVHDAINGGDSASDALLHTAPATVIAATEIYQVMKGKKTVDQALESSGQRVAMSVAAGAVGAVATAMLGPVGWLAGMAARMLMGNKLRESQRAYRVMPEKEINPRPKAKGPARKTTTKAEAEHAFKELDNITNRLFLEYKPS